MANRSSIFGLVTTARHSGCYGVDDRGSEMETGLDQAWLGADPASYRGTLPVSKRFAVGVRPTPLELGTQYKQGRLLQRIIILWIIILITFSLVLAAFVPLLGEYCRVAWYETFLRFIRKIKGDGKSFSRVE
jgi:hypothetical protein